MAHVRMRVGLRLERGPRGERDDEERLFFEGDHEVFTGWIATRKPPADAFVLEHGHIHADVVHLLLQDQVRLEGRDVVVASMVRLEGHPLGQVADHLMRAGRPGAVAHRATDLLVKQAHEVLDIYSDKQLRRQFAHAIRHPQLLTPRMQRSLLFLVLLSSIWVWVLGLTALAVVWPSAVGPWNAILLLYFHALGTNLFVPVPVEPVAVGTAALTGPLVAVAVGGFGKMVGAWIIFTLGPVLRRAMLKLESNSEIMRAFMGRAERFARRFGYVALGLMLAIPFSPFDIVPVYLFSGMGLRLRYFLLAVFAGFTLRLVLVVLLGEVLFGVGL